MSDVLVAGGGVIGASITVACGLRGTTTTCLDIKIDESPAASTAAGAMLGVFGEVCSDRLTPADRRETEFRLAAANAYPAWIEALHTLCDDPIDLRAGTLIIANHCGKDDLRNIAAIADEADRLGQKTEWLDIGQKLAGLEPHRHHAPAKALFLPQEKYLDARQLLGSLHSAIDRLGCTSRQALRVKAVLHDGNRVAGIRTACGKDIAASTVVLAPGVGLNDILSESGLEGLGLPRILAGKGSSAILGTGCAPPYVIRTPNRDFACGTHAVPLGDQRIYVGATNRISNTPGLAAGVTLGEVHAQFHSAVHEINVGLRQAVLMHTFSGLRPMSADGYPLVGATSLEGLYVATGTYRNGVLMAPLIAQIIAASVTGAEVPANPFEPLGRANLLSGPDAHLLERGIADLVSFVQEPHGQLPYNRQRELADLLTVLLLHAMGCDQDDVVTRFREAFDASPMAELVPWLMYEANAARDQKRSK